MSFSDADLARLKEDLARAAGEHKLVDRYEALLARLEAAELCVNRLIANSPASEETAIEAWRKAAGRE